VIARTGLGEGDMDPDSRILTDYLDTLNAQDKRVIINAMFALHGYAFKSKEWQDFFAAFTWYKPNASVKNSIDVFTERQKRLFQYLSK
jgi:hypothetical protein